MSVTKATKHLISSCSSMYMQTFDWVGGGGARINDVHNGRINDVHNILSKKQLKKIAVGNLFSIYDNILQRRVNKNILDLKGNILNNLFFCAKAGYLFFNEK